MRPVVDIHAHIYPEKIAAKAAQSIGAFYNIAMAQEDGTVARLLAELAATPVTHCVVHSVATRPAHVPAINDFIASSCADNPGFIGFMTMHQDFEDPAAEIERACALGLRGIKLHPDTQAVNLDDPRLMAVYEIAQARRLPVILHTGDYRYDFSHPRRLKRVLGAFPELVVNAAHFGGWSVFDYALELLEHERCYVDCSSAQEFLGPRRTVELCRAYGTDRVLFGSDFPMWSPSRELERFCALPFTPAELEAMTWHNAERFLGMQLA